VRILIIEDDRRLAEYLQQGLSEEQYAVDICHDGSSGLELARKIDYDLLVLDWMLPRQDGLTVCQQLRQFGRRMPIIMLSARSALNDKVTGLNSGADDYLAKPFAFEELLARIRAQLRRSTGEKGPDPSLLSVADLEMNLIARSVTRAGKSINLTGKEYALLEYLLRNLDHIVTETQIISHVWNLQNQPLTNVVSVYIHHLRRKIDHNQEPKLIHTIHSRGYKLGFNEV